MLIKSVVSTSCSRAVMWHASVSNLTACCRAGKSVGEWNSGKLRSDGIVPGESVAFDRESVCWDLSGEDVVVLCDSDSCRS